MSCKLDAGVSLDCDALQQGGIQNYFYILNYSELKTATVTVDTGVTEEITGITLTESGAAAYKITTLKSMNIIATSVLRAVDGVDGFDDTVDFRVNDIDQLVRTNLLRMRFNKVAIIVPLLDGRAMLYGARVNDTPEVQGVGLRLSDWQDNQGDAGVGGTLQAVAKTPDSDPPEVGTRQVIASTVDLEALLTPVP